MSPVEPERRVVRAIAAIAAAAVVAAALVLVAVPWWRAAARCPHRGPPVVQTLRIDGACELRGEVIDVDGNAVAGAVVVFADAIGEVRAVTAADGSYRMTRHPSGRTRVDVDADGRPPLRLREVRIVDPMVLALGCPAEMFDEVGISSPVHAGPSVPRLLHLRTELPPDEGPVVATVVIGGRGVAHEVVTPVAGVLEISLPAHGELELATKTLRQHCTWISLDPAALTARTLQTGCVLDRHGRPVPGAVVKLDLDGAIVPWAPLAFTDRAGRFCIAVCEHRHRLTARHPKAGVGGEWLANAEHCHLVVQ
ncbi:MAG: carboxypeptidase regulatory-like domain-containing protein [Planctomycetes bacterium]|jgi:hypothetical protein|nr:carboxypeptidase regulatory-like domain-containing protein [Planctomycetota bacterium]